jgi:hypothetical protein
MVASCERGLRNLKGGSQGPIWAVEPLDGCVASNAMIICERRTGKDVEGSSRDPLNELCYTCRESLQNEVTNYLSQPTS